MEIAAATAGLITAGLIFFRLTGDKYRGKVILTGPVLISLGVTAVTTYFALAA